MFQDDDCDSGIEPDYQDLMRQQEVQMFWADDCS